MTRHKSIKVLRVLSSVISNDIHINTHVSSIHEFFLHLISKTFQTWRIKCRAIFGCLMNVTVTIANNKDS